MPRPNSWGLHAEEIETYVAQKTGMGGILSNILLNEGIDVDSTGISDLRHLQSKTWLIYTGRKSYLKYDLFWKYVR